jgi:hypothetical protein
MESDIIMTLKGLAALATILGFYTAFATFALAAAVWRVGTLEKQLVQKKGEET